MVVLAPGGWSLARLVVGEFREHEYWEPDGGAWEGEIEGDEDLLRPVDECAAVKIVGDHVRQRQRGETVVNDEPVARHLARRARLAPADARAHSPRSA